ncbi:MAG: InlB B-repeat-containing protein, partial [Coriobacteriales bacterium]|nr:InlB B-repeat-containing protein [Coriobacteriales bacterium]
MRKRRGRKRYTTPARHYRGHYCGHYYRHHFGTVADPDYINPLTLLAKWEPNVYDIRYDTNGYGGLVPDTVKVAFPGKVPRPSDPMQYGYVFGGWYTQPDCAADARWDFATDTMPDKDLTLYAKWTKILA